MKPRWSFGVRALLAQPTKTLSLVRLCSEILIHFGSVLGRHIRATEQNFRAPPAPPPSAPYRGSGHGVWLVGVREIQVEGFSCTFEPWPTVLDIVAWLKLVGRPDLWKLSATDSPETSCR